MGGRLDGSARTATSVPPVSATNTAAVVSITALAVVLEACGDDAFVLVGSLVEFGHAMPAESRGALAAGLALRGASAARGAAVLLLLDPDRVVRCAVAGALTTVASSLSPTEVRRLVAMRNWRPENERAEVDGIVRKARAAGVDCAHRRDVLAGMDRLKHGRDLPHLGRGHVTEDVAIPVHDAPLPGHQANASIEDAAIQGIEVGLLYQHGADCMQRA
jgi:hypothetical protein